jgi:glutamine synthetase
MQGAAQGPIGVLPRSLRESLTAFCDGPAGREVLGDPLAACLAQLKESEAGRFEQWVKEAAPALDEVTEWEHREYFAIF